MSLSWRVTEGCRLLWRSWDDEHVVYNSGSASTHLLDSISGEALQIIEKRPSTTSEIASALIQQLDPQPDIQTLVAHLEKLLPKLHRSGLIEPDTR